jgi:N-acetylglucosaminyldiphosphoundecaprenol N-acetyl-beta-D-mannosaminyltransferase
MKFIKVSLFDIGVNASDPVQALSELEALIKQGKPAYVCFLEGNLLSRLPSDEALRNVLNDAALVYPDGVAVLKALQWNCQMPAERVPGPSMLLEACKYGLDKGWRHYFYGGGEQVAERLAERLCAQFPGLQIAGTYSPPFRELTDQEELEVKERIEASGATLLWVGLGGPKQEFWMARHLNKIRVPIMLGVGAAFDFHSGERPWAPKWMRKLGLEWLFRMISGGKKTFRRNLVCVPKVAIMLARERIRCIGK